MVIELNDQNFEKEVLKSDQPVLVDFSAPWCPACKQMEPTIKELAEEYKDKVKIGHVNVDENEKLAQNYNIMGIPAFFVFKGGEKVDEFKGAQAKENVKEILDKYI